MTPTQFNTGVASAIRMMQKYDLDLGNPHNFKFAGRVSIADDDDIRRGLSYRPKWARFAFDRVNDYCVNVDTLQVAPTTEIAALPDFDKNDVLTSQESRSFNRVLATKHLLPSIVAIDSNCSYLDGSSEVGKLVQTRQKFAGLFNVHVAGPASVHVVRLPSQGRFLSGVPFYLTIVDLGGAYTPEKDKPRMRVRAWSRPAAHVA